MRILGFLSTLLDRQYWVYLIGLLIPFVIYDLALKVAGAFSGPSAPELILILGLTGADIAFDLGYILLWVALFSAVRRGGRRLQRLMLLLFHATTMLVVLVSTCAYQYFQETGTTLDYGIIALWITKPEEVASVLTGAVPLCAWVLLFVALFYTAFGPWLLTRLVSKLRGWSERSSGRRHETSLLGLPGLFLLTLGFVWLSVVIGYTPSIGGTSFARDPFVNLATTGVEEAIVKEEGSEAGPPAEHPAAHASLLETPKPRSATSLSST